MFSPFNDIIFIKKNKKLAIIIYLWFLELLAYPALVVPIDIKQLRKLSSKWYIKPSLSQLRTHYKSTIPIFQLLNVLKFVQVARQQNKWAARMRDQ